MSSYSTSNRVNIPKYIDNFPIEKFDSIYSDVTVVYPKTPDSLLSAIESPSGDRIVLTDIKGDKDSQTDIEGEYASAKLNYLQLSSTDDSLRPRFDSSYYWDNVNDTTYYQPKFVKNDPRMHAPYPPVSTDKIIGVNSNIFPIIGNFCFRGVELREFITSTPTIFSKNCFFGTSGMKIVETAGGCSYYGDILKDMHGLWYLNLPDYTAKIIPEFTRNNKDIELLYIGSSEASNNITVKLDKCQYLYLPNITTAASLSYVLPSSNTNLKELDISYIMNSSDVTIDPVRILLEDFIRPYYGDFTLIASGTNLDKLLASSKYPFGLRHGNKLRTKDRPKGQEYVV